MDFDSGVGPTCHFLILNFLLLGSLNLIWYIMLIRTTAIQVLYKLGQRQSQTPFSSAHWVLDLFWLYQSWPDLFWLDLSRLDLTRLDLTWPYPNWLVLTWPVLTWSVLTWPDLTWPVLTWSLPLSSIGRQCCQKSRCHGGPKIVNFCRTESYCTKNWGRISPGLYWYHQK